MYSVLSYIYVYMIYAQYNKHCYKKMFTALGNSIPNRRLSQSMDHPTVAIFGSAKSPSRSLSIVFSWPNLMGK